MVNLLLFNLQERYIKDTTSSLYDSFDFYIFYVFYVFFPRIIFKKRTHFLIKKNHHVSRERALNTLILISFN